jgi:hypothetical protein
MSITSQCRTPPYTLNKIYQMAKLLRIKFKLINPCANDGPALLESPACLFMQVIAKNGIKQLRHCNYFSPLSFLVVFAS